VSENECQTVQADPSEPATAAPVAARRWTWASVGGQAGETTQTVITGLILAFIFRAFFVEPFIIPSGSMAESLLGAHATRTCPQCGWEYDFAPAPTASPADGAFVLPAETVCPNCRHSAVPQPEDTIPKAGDRILVHKWLYALGGLLQPQRWDVIVFRDPANPDQHFIKRLIGLPGESLEIVDGDVFINGRIARKTPEAQQVLWHIVFDQSHLPEADDAVGRWPRWVALNPPPEDGHGWSGMDTRVIRYDAPDATPRSIVFNPDTGREYLMDLCGYDGRSSGAFVGDVRIVAEMTLGAGDGLCRWELTRPPHRFGAELRSGGAVELRMESTDAAAAPPVIHAVQLPAFALGRPYRIEFGHVDYRVYLKIDQREVLATTDAEYPPPADAVRDPGLRRPVGLSVTAANLRLELRGLRVDRDVYYTPSSDRTRRAAPGNPFVLGADEYFVLGDNSPHSHDSREWTEVGPHLPPDYRPGTVRRDQIVGLAAFVYLPGLLPLDARGRMRVPDMGRVRFVR
jgi:signal peptidase I